MADFQELNESRARSFSQTWLVAPEYRIIEGQVCPLVDGELIIKGTVGHPSEGCDQYFPMARTEIPGELARVATGRESDLLAFVQRYGLLGYSQEVLGTRLSQLVGREQDEVKDRALHGDPVPWVLAHAETVRLVLRLLGLLDDAAPLQEFLETLKVRRTSGPVGISYRVASRGYSWGYPTTTTTYYPTQIDKTMSPDARPRDVALRIVANVLEENNVGGVSRFLLVEDQQDERQGFTSLFKFRNLLDCVYWHLADAAVGGWVRRCADPRCGAFFVAKSERVKYCPPPFGFKGVSPCMNRHKQRVYQTKPMDKRKRKGKR